MSTAAICTSSPACLKSLISKGKAPCQITLVVLGILLAVVAIVVGTLGLKQALSLKFSHSVSLLVGGAVVGLSLVFFSLYRLCAVPVKEYNEGLKTSVAAIRSGVKFSQSFGREGSSRIIRAGSDSLEVQEFQITKGNVDAVCAQINAALDEHTRNLRKVELFSEGFINGNNGAITVRLIRK